MKKIDWLIILKSVADVVLVLCILYLLVGLVRFISVVSP